MGEQREIEDEVVDRALTRFFYGKILDALSEAEQQLVDEEEYMAAAKVRDKITSLEKEFKVKLK